MKFIIYQHTHWDREWYFSEAVSKQLLINNFKQLLNNQKYYEKFSENCFYLDGQWSLFDDLFHNLNNEEQEKFLTLIKNKNLILGPWYSQPDFFNSLGETIIRNLEVGKHIAKKYNLNNSQIAYCPDSFGFTENLPQILNYMNIHRFLFWRGMKHNQKNESFNWKSGYSIVQAYCLKYGYFILGHYIDWKLLNNPKNIKIAALKFYDQFLKSDLFKEVIRNNKSNTLIGCGHDQAPFYLNLKLFWKEVNNIFNTIDINFNLSNQESIFDISKLFKETISNQKFNYGYYSKIHRTISSSRYKFKKLFRDCEKFLFHQLEPLQLKFRFSHKNYFPYQNLELNKNLLKFQAHDILGGCVSDRVYLESYFELKKTYTSLKSNADYLLRLYAQNNNLNNNHIIFFNPLFNQEEKQILKLKITLQKKYSGYYENNQFIVYVHKIIKNKEIFEKCFDHQIIIVNKKLKPFDFTIFDLNNLKSIKENKESVFKSKYSLLFQFDDGDTYDYDPGKNNYDQKYLPEKILKLKIGNLLITSYQFFINNKQKFFLEEINYQNISDIYLYTINKTKNCRYSLIFEEISAKDSIKYLECLKLVGLKHEKIDWQKLNYQENPVNNFSTSGLLFFLRQNKIITSLGNNEFFFYENKLTFVLYRNVGFLGKAHLINRPGNISGLSSKKICTPLAQNLNQKLKFNFGIYNSQKINATINSWMKKPLWFHHNSINVETDLNGQFILEPSITWKNNLNHDYKIQEKELLQKNNKNKGYIFSSWIDFNNQIKIEKIDLENLDNKINSFKI